jgi:hypothetical protein
VNRLEEIAARSQTHQLVIKIPDGSLGVVQVALKREHHVGFAFPLAAQQFPDLGESGFQFLQLSWSQFNLSARIGDFHGFSQLKPFRRVRMTYWSGGSVAS